MFNRLLLICCCLLLLLTAPQSSSFNKGDSETTSRKPFAAANTVSPAAISIDTYLQENQFQGTILIADRGTILLNKGYGMARTNENIPNHPQTIFRIASLTKAFTALAIMQLQEAGKLHVQDPLSRYLPDMKAGDQMTIHQLLAHLSGLPREFEEEVWDDPAKRLQEKLQTDFTLQSEPGKTYSYSNVGYVILGHLIEKVSGQAYEDYMKEHIFEPLKMKHTFVESYIDLELDEQAEGYETNLFGFRRPVDFFRSDPGPGGISSTVEDLYLWDRALYSNQLASMETRNALFADHDPSMGAYGYGWGIDITNSGVYSHQGYIPGFYSFISRDTEKQQTVIVLSNHGEEGYNLFEQREVHQLIEKLFNE
ncbi:Putative penicillin-binding protein PbpX [Paenibacillus plantiphilus]|uniref:Penicillin-binding protein PbpX n=2 Tax=Paenibacillus plantiphilus TaxID=2905650 RepID=A0ABM9CM40_9BACL|nr:Putative penicillin-binding protein PbpX [Paenibacillus plantiphilus]